MKETGIVLRPEVQWFAGIMESKLQQADGWKDENALWLFERLVQEVFELHEALIKTTYSEEDVIKECADVANFAMMIADIIVAAKEVKNELRRQNKN